MKAVATAQQMLNLMGLTRNLFAVDVGRYSNSATVRKQNLKRLLALGIMQQQSFFALKI